MIHSKLRKMYGEKIFKTVINIDTKVRESQVMNMPIIYYYKHSPSGLRYISLAKEVLESAIHG
jgi:cellulose biosynthesis protein BcsQ